MRFLFLAFLTVPLVEMLLLFEVSDRIGGLWTLALVVLTAVIGIQILKQQGFSTLLRARTRLESGELPAQEIIEGMMLAAAGALLLTPGFLTDTIGFVLLSGPLRRPLARRIIRAGVVTSMGAGAGGFQTWSNSRPPPSGHGNVYEGEYSKQPDSKLDRPESDSDQR
ncbi:MAG: FxsA family protein [Pseudomonadales bacterium]|nr:FxsA family protein [Pseudomonadales bacterium]